MSQEFSQYGVNYHRIYISTTKLKTLNNIHKKVSVFFWYRLIQAVLDKGPFNMMLLGRWYINTMQSTHGLLTYQYMEVHSWQPQQQQLWRNYSSRLVADCNMPSNHSRRNNRSLVDMLHMVGSSNRCSIRSLEEADNPVALLASLLVLHILLQAHRKTHHFQVIQSCAPRFSTSIWSLFLSFWTK